MTVLLDRCDPFDIGPTYGWRREFALEWEPPAPALSPSRQVERDALEAALWRIWPASRPAQIDEALAVIDSYTRGEHDRRTGRRQPSSRPLAPCGTASAYRRHVRRREFVDEACKRAHADEVRFYAHAKGRAA